MREIKFRAWDKMGSCWITEFAIDELSNFMLFDGEDYYLSGDSAEPILMQYTGLKDKNGVEIYEGDIVRDSRIEESEAVIEYCQPIAAFVARPIIKAPYDVYQLNEGNTMGSLKLSYTEVIGNIYENPDLLKAGPNE